MTGPGDGPGIPSRLEAEYADWEWEVAWQSVPEVVTYRLWDESGHVCYLKVAEAGWFPGLEAEAARMAWAGAHLPVPEVIQHASDGDVSWLLTRGLAGRPATDPFFGGDLEALVRILARGLRRFHEAPVADCPFDFRLERALAHIRLRLAEGRIDAERDFHPEFGDFSAEEAIEHLERTRPGSESAVVCHGDYCLPNVLIEHGDEVGFVDLGELGVADRWWDLAVATWSVTWNLGPGHEDLFLSEYGVERDEGRVEFYRLLYDVVS